jgi:hypothetical protein
MSIPLFTTGQSVSVAISKRYRYPIGSYRVVSAMPSGGGPTLYRIKGDLEKFERVIEEIHLAAA